MSFSTPRKLRPSAGLLALNPGLDLENGVVSPSASARVVTVTTPLDPLLACLPPRASGPANWRAHLAAQDRKAARATAFASEHKMQAALIQWSHREVRAGRLLELALLFAVPNGGKRNARTAKFLKDEGVRPGVPDLVLPVPCGGCHGACLELKLPDNRPTPSQEAWLDLLESYGYKVAVAFSLPAAKDFLTGYLTP